VALLAFASGCSGGSQEKIALYPVVDGRGVITYVTKDPGTRLAEENDRIAQWQRQQSDEADRQQRKERGLQEVARYRKAERDKIDQTLQRQREQNEQDDQDRMRRRQAPRPGYQPSPLILPDPMRLQRDAQELDKALEELRRGQESYSRQPR
jgi:membrane protein involved in colicin uptake